MADPMIEVVLEKDPEVEVEIAPEQTEAPQEDTAAGADAKQPNADKDDDQLDAEPRLPRDKRNKVTAKERIDQLTREKHEIERRERVLLDRLEQEARSREEDRASLNEMREQLVQIQRGTVQSQIAAAKTDVDTRIAGVKKILKDAAEDGNHELLAESAAELASLNAAKQRINEFDVQQQRPAPQPDPRTQQRQPQQQPQVDPSLAHYRAEFVRANEWIRTHPELNGLLLGMDQRLAAEGFDPRTREYWDELPRRLAPHLTAAGIIEPEPAPPQQQRQPSRQPTTQVAGVTRAAPSASTSPNRVTLTPDEVRIAQGFGLTPQQYAAEKIRIQARDASRF